MAKPYPGYKGNNLVSINPKAIAFVTEGANMKKFFLYKSKTNNNGEKTMEKSVAISLLKAGNLTKEQEQVILNAVEPSDLRDVMKFAKSSNDPEGNSMGAFMKEFLPQIAKAVSAEIKKADETADINLIHEILDKLDQLLENEESEDGDLGKAIEENEKSCGEPYAKLKKKWEDGTLEDAEAKEYMKMKKEVRAKARKSLKENKLKAEKEAIEALSAEEGKKNQQGEMKEEGFDKGEENFTDDEKKVKKIFEEDREITDPKEIANLMALAERGVESGAL